MDVPNLNRVYCCWVIVLLFSHFLLSAAVGGMTKPFWEIIFQSANGLRCVSLVFNCFAAQCGFHCELDLLAIQWNG